jgi:hypothetical protein
VRGTFLRAFTKIGKDAGVFVSYRTSRNLLFHSFFIVFKQLVFLSCCLVVAADKFRQRGLWWRFGLSVAAVVAVLAWKGTLGACCETTSADALRPLVRRLDHSSSWRDLYHKFTSVRLSTCRNMAQTSPLSMSLRSERVSPERCLSWSRNEGRVLGVVLFWLDPEFWSPMHPGRRRVMRDEILQPSGHSVWSRDRWYTRDRRGS